MAGAARSEGYFPPGQFHGIGLAVIGLDQFQSHRRAGRAADEVDTFGKRFALQ